MHYVYLLQSLRDHDLYVGYTPNIRQRVIKHNRGEVISTKSRRPFLLVYYEAYAAREDAIARERSLKQHGRVFQSVKNRLKKSLRHW